MDQQEIAHLEEQLVGGEKRGDDAGALAQAVVVRLMDLYLDSLKVEQALDLFNRYSRHFDEDQELALTLKTGQVLTFGEAWDLSLKCFGRCAEICRERGNDAALAEINGFMATAHRKMGELERAMELHQEQELLGQRCSDPNQVAAGCAGQGVLWEENEDWEPAVEFLARAVKMYRELGNGPALAIVQARLSRADYMDSRDAVAAVEMLAQTHQLSEEPQILGRVGETSYLLGLHLCDDGELDSSMKVLKLAHRALEKAGDGAGMADCLLGMADVEVAWGKQEEALDHLGRASKLWEQVGDRAGLADTYGRIGMVHNRFGRPNEAIQFFGQAMQILDEIGDREGLASVFHAIGRLYLEHEAPESGETFMVKAVQTMAALEEPDPGVLARARRDLAKVYVALKKKPDEAMSLMEEARDFYLGEGDADGAADVMEEMDAARETQ